MTDDLKQSAEAVVRRLKTLSASHGHASDVVASTAAEAVAVITALLEAEKGKLS